MRLEGKVAIITGGGSGIGREIAIGYAREGADTVLCARKIERLQAVAKEVEEIGRKALALKVDITKRKDVDEMAQKTIQEFGKIDILVNNSGIFPINNILDVSEEEAVSNAEAIIALGNDSVRQTYAKFPHVFILNNAAYFDNHYDQVKKDFLKARKNFFFFAGAGNVHKGLDLLLEAFSQLNVHLYICQKIKPNFYKIYQKELEGFANIHLIGRVKMRSSQFYKIVDKCAFLIHPSCADGSPGAVVECMHQGLIPVLSRETGIDTENYGVMLNTCSIKEIIKTGQNLSQRSVNCLKKMSQRTWRTALDKYSQSTFLANMKKAIKTAITTAHLNGDKE